MFFVNALWTNKPTDKASYEDAWTHLKRSQAQNFTNMSKGQRINSQKTRNRAKRQSIDKKTKLRDKE